MQLLLSLLLVVFAMSACSTIRGINVVGDEAVVAKGKGVSGKSVNSGRPVVDTNQALKKASGKIQVGAHDNLSTEQLDRL